MTATDLVQKLKTLRPRLENEGVRHLILFGSQARGSQTADSDIDIAIDVESESRFSIINLVGVEQIVSEAIGIPANAFMRRSLDQEFRSELDREGIEVF
ncbi:nucleotidyltransferase domain-containing protein [Pseudohoeflea suaedae]|uniref:Nucleotidyltransferase domain-containing protein n=1 Tax=Pseudohoeflea suaedae TaxID=877384 RepID=A0A4V3A7J9_9HYPH|nr:nucleotidyltransferase domain-containing protein [Pseudohoeflea suaedae]TDH39055.1 nucleotidyltransferase domain-containing protein [Pseudohoeflea suaedae]